MFGTCIPAYPPSCPTHPSRSVSSHPSLWLTGSSQILDLCRNLNVGFRGQRETASLADAVTQQSDVLLESGGVMGQAQHKASCLGQRCGLVLRTSWKAGPQEMWDSGVTALFPALRRQNEWGWGAAQKDQRITVSCHDLSWGDEGKTAVLFLRKVLGYTEIYFGLLVHMH